MDIACKLVVALAFTSSLGAQSLRILPRSTSTTGTNDSALTLVSDSAFRTRAASIAQLRKALSVNSFDSLKTTVNATAGSSGVTFYRSLDALGALTTGTNIAQFKFFGWDGTSYGQGGSFNFFASENWGTGAHGGGFRFRATQLGSVGLRDVLTGYYDTLAVNTNDIRTLTITGGASAKLTGGAGNMTLQCGTGNSRTCTIQSTTSAGVVKNTLVLGADTTATFLGQVRAPYGTASIPGISFPSASGTYNNGFFISNPGVDSLSLVLGGTTYLNFSGGQIDRPSGALNIFAGSANAVGLGDAPGGASLQVGSISGNRQVYVALNGAASFPALVIGQTNKGFYATTDTIFVATGGARSLAISGGATPTIAGGNGNSIWLAGTGASRTLALQATDASQAATDVLVLSTNGSPTWRGGGTGTLSIQAGVNSSMGINLIARNASNANITDLALGTDSSATFLGKIVPNSTKGIVGTTTNDNAVAGAIGEYIVSTIASASAVSLTTGTSANMTSISLTAGDWEVSCNLYHKLAATTTTTLLQGGISTTSATLPTATGGTADYAAWRQTSSAPGGDVTQDVGPTRLSLSGTTTTYCVANDAFATSTDAAYGTLRARRVR